MSFRFGKIGGFGISGFNYSGFQQIFDTPGLNALLQKENKVCCEKTVNAVTSAAKTGKEKIPQLKSDVFTKESKISK